VKQAAARVNRAHGLDGRIADAIEAAAAEVASRQYDDKFPLVIWQTGSGTQTNMNVNEVIAGIANEALTGTRGGKSPVHPNDHVNRASPPTTASRPRCTLRRRLAASRRLFPALERLEATLLEKARAWDDIVKIGRTHLQDATPLTLGDEFSGYYAQVRWRARGWCR
jgi:fumarate hydratase class II